LALYSKAKQELIKPGPNDPRLDVVVGSIGHVAVSEGSDLYNWFNGPSGGVESHFYIQRDGDVIQYRDTRYEADAQGLGNSWLVGSQRYGFVSYETQGMGEGEWTPEQLASIKALITWVNETHGSPWQKTPAYRGRGHGYHSLFPEWNPNGHTCPGPDRIVQFNNIIVPWLNSGGKEVDMEPEDLLRADVFSGSWSTPTNPTWTYQSLMTYAAEWGLAARNQSQANAKAIAALNAAVLAIGQKLDALPADVIEALGQDYEAHVELIPKDDTPTA
jgi:hypothetical protein